MIGGAESTIFGLDARNPKQRIFQSKEHTDCVTSIEVDKQFFVTGKKNKK